MARDREPEDADRELQITMTPPVTAVTPMPPSPPGADVSAWGPGAPTGIPNVAVPSDPSGTTQITQRPQTAFDRIVPGSALSGHFDAWVGEVITTFPDGDPFFGDTNSISVRRVIVEWGINNEPSSDDAPRAWSQPATGPVIARPFPPRHDQPKYIVAGTNVAPVGDIVTVITGTDGLHWYIRDELPFVGTVRSVGDTTEDNCGGAGLTKLKVRRQKMTGDPASGPANLEDLKDAGETEIDYTDVLVIKTDEQQHGYRCGDRVWVQRRGNYYFTSPAQESFVAHVRPVGPDSEADFVDINYYWVAETSAVVNYTEGANDYTVAHLTRDTDGGGGRQMRYVQAQNLGETVADHGLLTNGTLTVIVHVGADPSNGKPFYVFSHSYIPNGIIVMWSGTLENKPSGWILCDGQDGTPDLRGRFIMGLHVGGLSGENAIDATGGYRWHGMTENNHPDHLHHVHNKGDLDMTAAGSDFSTFRGQNTGNQIVSPDGAQLLTQRHGGTVNAWPGGLTPTAEAHANADTDNRPRYYVLAFIMKAE